MNKDPSELSPQVQESSVRLVREQRGAQPSMPAAVESIAPMIGWQISRLCWSHAHMSDRAGKDTKSSIEDCAGMNFIRIRIHIFLQD